MSITKLSVGQIVWELCRLGGVMVAYPIEIVAIDRHATTPTVTASWNGNKPFAYKENKFKTWKVDPGFAKIANGATTLTQGPVGMDLAKIRERADTHKPIVRQVGV
jgi:hypothetical protein